MSVLTIIPARSGSKRLPGKNWEKVGGETLVWHAVKCACDALLDPIVVTDRPTQATGNVRVVEEPEELARDDVSLARVINWTVAHTKATPDWIVLLQPTSPLRLESDVRHCLNIAKRTNCDSVVSVVGKREPGGNTRYEHNGAIFIMKGWVPHSGACVAGWTQFYVMPPERSIDINTAEDLAEARRLAGDA